MKLGQKAIQVLEKWGAFTDDRHSLAVENDSFSIVAEILTADSLSCTVSQLRLEPRADRRLSSEELQAWGNRLAQRVRYLLEAIETVEFDSPNGRLLLRSTPPEKKPDGSVFYYELLLEANGRMTLERRRFDPQQRSRKTEPMHCTREVLEKLIDDVTASAV